jgi:hypothetical protein
VTLNHNVPHTALDSFTQAEVGVMGRAAMCRNEDCRFEDGTVMNTVKVSSTNGHDDEMRREKNTLFKKNF